MKNKDDCMSNFDVIKSQLKRKHLFTNSLVQEKGIQADLILIFNIELEERQIEKPFSIAIQHNFTKWKNLNKMKIIWSYKVDNDYHIEREGRVAENGLEFSLLKLWSTFCCPSLSWRQDTQHWIALKALFIDLYPWILQKWHLMNPTAQSQIMMTVLGLIWFEQENQSKVDWHLRKNHSLNKEIWDKKTCVY